MGIQHSYKEKKTFGPLDDLFDCLNDLEKLFSISISDEHYKIGRQQLFTIFLHETLHAFITAKAGWIHSLDEAATDFVDEVVVRIVMDSVIEKNSYQVKINPYYSHHVKHETDLPDYGFNLSPTEYRKLETQWKLGFEDKLDIDGFARIVHEYFKENTQLLCAKSV